MLDKYFSKRHGLRPESFGLVYEHVPDSARTGLYRILEKYFEIGTIGVNQLYSNICHALCMPPQKAGFGRTPDLPRDMRQSIKTLIMECEWWQFYDICEVIPYVMGGKNNKNIIIDNGRIDTMIQGILRPYFVCVRSDKYPKSGSFNAFHTDHMIKPTAIRRLSLITIV